MQENAEPTCPRRRPSTCVPQGGVVDASVYRERALRWSWRCILRCHSEPASGVKPHGLADATAHEPGRPAQLPHCSRRSGAKAGQLDLFHQSRGLGFEVGGARDHIAPGGLQKDPREFANCCIVVEGEPFVLRRCETSQEAENARIMAVRSPGRGAEEVGSQMAGHTVASEEWLDIGKLGRDETIEQRAEARMLSGPDRAFDE